jgi:hypothetical protein
VSKTTQRAGEAVPDEVYGVVSALYHALKGAQAYATYSDDARRARDEELVEFFESCRSDENERAREAKILLAERLETMDDADEDVEGFEETASGRDDDDLPDEPPSNGPATSRDDEEEDYQPTPSRDERISGR